MHKIDEFSTIKDKRKRNKAMNDFEVGKMIVEAFEECYKGD